jgi:hypothetical protein
LGAIAIIPSAPALVPGLVGAAAPELADLRVAVLAAAAALPPRWVAIGAGGPATTFGAECVGTFAGFGVDERVRLSPQATGEPVNLALPALIAGWVRERARPEATVETRIYGDDLDAAQSQGRVLRAEIDALDDPVGVLVVADGANTLTAAAPGGHCPGDVEVQHGLDEALGRGETAVLARLPAQVVGRAAFAVLAGLTGRQSYSATVHYRGAPYGVGYFAGVWLR